MQCNAISKEERKGRGRKAIFTKYPRTVVVFPNYPFGTTLGWFSQLKLLAMPWISLNFADALILQNLLVS